MNFEQQANHFRISELYADSTDIRIFHRYLPEKDFIGKDSVQIRSNWRGDDSEEIVIIDRVKVLFTVE